MNFAVSFLPESSELKAEGVHVMSGLQDSGLGAEAWDPRLETHTVCRIRD